MNHKNLLVVALALMALALGVTAVSANPAGPASTSTQQASSVLTSSRSTVAPLTTLGSGFTYQGRLTSGGNPANGQYDLVFTLFDAPTAGAQVGTAITLTNQTVTGGIFTVNLDFTSAPFQGSGRWMEIGVRQTGGGSFTTLSPREPLTPMPYAMSLIPGAVVSGSTGPGGIMFQVNNGGGNAMAGFSGSASDSALYGVNSNAGVNGVGVKGQATGGTGVQGTGPTGVQGTASGSSGFGVVGTSSGGWGGYFTSSTGPGVQGSSSSSIGVYGNSSTGVGVRGNSSGGYGVSGTTASTSSAAVIGLSTGGGGFGILGQADADNLATGVEGKSTLGAGVIGIGATLGVAGSATGGQGVYGTSMTGNAGWFDGNVRITGTCCAASEGTYQIDDPLDPANKYLNQAVVESPDMLDMLNGNVTTDARGSATIALPAYFQAVNRDFRYQLTVVGEQFAQVRVSSKLKDNNFSIMTDKPSVEISWQVTGTRSDPYAQAHPLTPEQSKPANEKGYYLHPDLYGQPNSKNVSPYARNPQPIPMPVRSAIPGGK